MMEWNKEEKVIKLLLGELPEEEARELRLEMEKNSILKKEFETYQKVWSEYRTLPILKADQNGADRFDQWLSQQKIDDGYGQRPSRPKIGYFKHKRLPLNFC